MGPIAAVWARALRDRGHEIEVISGYPHYPPGLWEQRVLPYREVRDGICVTRLPLWIGHATTLQRVREELTYAASAAMAAAVFSRPDVVVTVSPSFLALAPAIANIRARRLPWILWLQDIFPDAAETTGLLSNPLALRPARLLESAAYRAADRIVVISETFRRNLLGKGVPEAKIERVYNPATRRFGRKRPSAVEHERPRILCMGNIGHSQGLAEFVRAFQGSAAGGDACLVITGTGELAEAVRDEIRSDRVEMLGLVSDEMLEEELDRASLGLVSQRGDIREFNLPSKLMNLMARGIPILASVHPYSETARIVRDSGAGWMVDASRPEELARTIARALSDDSALEDCGAAALAFARGHFTPQALAARFDEVLLQLT